MTILATSTPNTAPALQAQPAKIEVLTSFRFFAAAGIIVYHLNGMLGLPFEFAPYFPGGQPVGFFFVLSGFILSYVYPTLDRRTAPRFFLARFARLWPAHIAALILLLLVTPVTREALFSGHQIGPFFANICMVHSWIPRDSYCFSFNGPSWSIATEYGFYFLFPFLLWNFQRDWWLKVILSFALLFGLITYCNHYPLPFNLTSYTLLGFHPLTRLMNFVLGMTAALFFRRYLVPSRWSSTTAALIETFVLAVTLLVMYWNYEITVWTSAQLGLGDNGATALLQGGVNCFFFAATIAVYALQRGPISRFLGSPLLVVLGEVSFSIYLLHQFLLFYVLPYTRAFSQYPAWLFPLEIAIAIVLLAHLVWLLIERPARDLIVRLGSHYLLRLPPKTPAVKKHEPYTGWRWVAVSASLLTLIIAANVYIIFHHPNIRRVSDSQAQTLLDASRPDLRDIAYGKSLVLRGLTAHHEPDAITVQLLWQTRAAYPLKGRFGVHLLDAKGNRVGQLDYYLDYARTTVPADTQWIDRLVVYKDQYPTAATFALCLVEYDPEIMTTIDKGPRDWDNHRLLIPLNP